MAQRWPSSASATWTAWSSRSTLRGWAGEPPLQLGAERIVWATGLRPATPPIAGLARSECNATAAGMESLAARLRIDGRRVVVIGAGLIGSETAATLAHRHSVTLLDYADRPLARFHDSISTAAVGALTDAGVRFVGGCQVSEVTGTSVVTGTHGSFSADVVVRATGVRSSLPDTLAAAPVATLDTDETLRLLGHPNIWACGDVARFPHPRYGLISVPHWDHARASGRHAAEAAMGSHAAYTRDPYWFSDIGRLRIQQVGLSDAAVDWRSRDGIQVGHDDAGRAACAVLLDAPHRLRDARRLLVAA